MFIRIRSKYPLIQVVTTVALFLSSCPASNALLDEIVAAPFKIAGEVVELAVGAGGVAIDASGCIVDGAGKVVGVTISGLDGNGKQKSKNGNGKQKSNNGNVISINQKRDEIIVASFYNRMAAMDELIQRAVQTGNVSEQKSRSLQKDVKEVRASLRHKMDSGSELKFNESLEICKKLDKVAEKVRRECNVTAEPNAPIFHPTVIKSKTPPHKRLAVFTMTEDSTVDRTEFWRLEKSK